MNDQSLIKAANQAGTAMGLAYEKEMLRLMFQEDTANRTTSAPIKTRRKKTKRGAHARVNRRRNDVLQKRVEETFAKRFTHCAVCGLNVHDGQTITQRRTVGAWTIYICERHDGKELGCTATLDGRVRFHEVPA